MNHEETDTWVILYLKHLESLDCPAALIQTLDTDILMITLLHAHAFSMTIMLDIGSGKHRQVINVTLLSIKLGCDYCSMLVGLYIYTGEDVTSAFNRKKKIGPLKKLKFLHDQKAFRYISYDIIH